ncbi:MAG TPA: hypothetical protein PKD64_14910 [Pirellulaceae bacterium]|nr:hypothetical protein [Pirellulaceae bacterium]HMO93473.1 hypothetical protein [Pirellulaceae bacterium]HMP69212.1 hypothetical protein [Pirellulaceae bacterium]
MNGNSTSRRRPVSCFLLFGFLLAGALIANGLVGCSLMKGKQENDKYPTAQRATNWDHIGRGTGIDPRAKAIEHRLGYE